MNKTHLPKAQRLKSATEARAEFDRKGLSIAAWARANRVGKSLVYEILAGHKKCKRGDSHRVAVLLGMKHGELGAQLSTHGAIPSTQAED